MKALVVTIGHFIFFEKEYTTTQYFIKIKFTNNYVYLGVPFSSKGKFLLATKFHISKASFVGSKVQDIIKKSNFTSETFDKLLQALVNTILL